MPVTNYYSVNGQIIGERTAAATRTNYSVDALGSVTGTLVSGAIQNTYAYNPYGSLLQKTGVGTDPAFTWIGARGYRNTRRQYAESYIRARTYSTLVGRWTSKDSQWPREPAYGYSKSCPSTYIDPKGTCPWYYAVAAMLCITYDVTYHEELNLTYKREKLTADDLGPFVTLKQESKTCKAIVNLWMPDIQEVATECLKEGKDIPGCVAKKTGGQLGDSYWKWLACTFGNQFRQDPKSGDYYNPCGSEDQDCEGCCEGIWIACTLKCNFDKGADCQDKCRNEQSAYFKCMDALSGCRSENKMDGSAVESYEWDF